MARVTADNGDRVLGGVLGLANDGGDKGSGTDNVKGGDTEEAEELVVALDRMPTAWGRKHQPCGGSRQRRGQLS